MIGAVLLITFLDLLLGLESRGLGDIFMMGMALAVASMSEFFTAIGYIIIACSVVGGEAEESHTGAKIKNPAALEALGGVRTILMRDDVILKSGAKRISAFYRAGKMYSAPNAENAPELLALLSLSLLALGRTADSPAAPAVFAAAPGEAETLETFYRELVSRGTADPYRHRYLIAAHSGVAGSSRHETTLAVENTSQLFYAYSFGDFTRILADCVSYRSGDAALPLTADVRKSLTEEALSLWRAGNRRTITCAASPCYSRDSVWRAFSVSQNRLPPAALRYSPLFGTRASGLCCSLTTLKFLRATLL